MIPGDDDLLCMKFEFHDVAFNMSHATLLLELIYQPFVEVKHSVPLSDCEIIWPEEIISLLMPFLCSSWKTGKGCSLHFTPSFQQIFVHLLARVEYKKKSLKTLIKFATKYNRVRLKNFIINLFHVTFLRKVLKNQWKNTQVFQEMLSTNFN